MHFNFVYLFNLCGVFVTNNSSDLYQLISLLQLEKALRETNEEQVQLKLASDSKLAEANKLIIGIGEKSAEIENKLQAAEAKLVYVCIKSTELNIRLEEVEARESVLQKEHQTLISEYYFFTIFYVEVLYSL